jgi:hypothetical protein
VPNSSKGRELQSGDDFRQQFVGLLPVLYYRLNRILDSSAPSLSRKVMVVLWAASSSDTKDDVGKFITMADINRIFREWFVVSENNVASEVSKVKNELFNLNFIKIEGGRDHIHLTQKGDEAARLTLKKAAAIVQETLDVLAPDEQALLSEFAGRILSSMRKPASKQLPLGLDEQTGVA